MPDPMKASDYLVVGSVATLVSLLVLFFLLAFERGEVGPFPEEEKKSSNG